MLTNDQLAIIANLDRQIDIVVKALVEAKGNEVETACLVADYDNLTAQVAEIRAEALDTAEMAQKRTDRLVELGNLGRAIDRKTAALATLVGDAWTRTYADLCDLVSHRNAIGDEMNAMLGYRAY